MGWLQNILSNKRRLDEIEIDELRLLQQKSRELGKLLEDMRDIMERAIRDKIEKAEALKRGRKPMNILLPRDHEELMAKIKLVENNLEEELRMARYVEIKEKKRKE